MKLKYYLRGLGVGVICTAIVMGIALSGNKKETLTDAEIIERARLLGMVMEDGELDSGKETSEQEGTGNDKAAGQKIESITPEGQSGEEKSGDESEKDEESDDEESDKQSDNDLPDSGSVVGQSSGSNQNVVELEIKQGEFSDVISKKLFQAGLIPDAEKFNAYMTQKGVDDSLSVGVHLIPVGSTADEIIEILQEKP